ncbi:trypsin-like serine protease [Staphylococcus agnetis]|uniref:trypsin-like serine protease n=1 Tax=Staphylococcus agnetis TaxID=985762 RepID=UPI003390694B
MCTAVLLGKNKAVTAAHCINNKEGSVGTLYLAQSSELSTPLGYNTVTTGYSFPNKDIALLSWDTPSNSTNGYIGDKKWT